MPLAIATRNLFYNFLLVRSLLPFKTTGCITSLQVFNSPLQAALRTKNRPKKDEKLVLKKVYSTGYSQAVTHPSTNPAQRCLTSVIGRELVLSAWYGRRHSLSNSTAYLYTQQSTKKAFNSPLQASCITGKKFSKNKKVYNTRYSQAVKY